MKQYFFCFLLIFVMLFSAGCMKQHDGKKPSQQDMVEILDDSSEPSEPSEPSVSSSDTAMIENEDAAIEELEQELNDALAELEEDEFETVLLE